MHIVQSGDLVSALIFWLFFCFNLAIWHIERVSREGKWSPSLSERESLKTLHTVTALCDLQCLERCFACGGQPGWKTVRGDPWSKVSLRGKVDVLTLSVQRKWCDKKGIATPGLGKTIWDNIQFFRQRKQQFKSGKEGVFRVADASSCWESLELSG